MPIQEGANVGDYATPTSREQGTRAGDAPVKRNDGDGSDDDRKGSVDPLTSVSPRSPEKGPPRTDSSPIRDATDPRTPYEMGRRKRKRGRHRKRRPRRNDLTDKVAAKVFDGVICLMTSKIYNVLGSIATEGNAFKPRTIAVDTC